MASEIYCLKYADSVLGEDQIFPDGDKEKFLPITFAIYLIKCEDRRFLVDAGCETMPGFQMEHFRSPVDVLAELGLTAEDITDVVITHAHHDHIEAVHHFPHAVLHIQKSEYENGKAYITDTMKVHTFEKEFALAAGVRIVTVGGHSVGSAVVEVKTGGKIHVLAGDACYTNANVEQKICTGTFCDRKQAEAFVEKYANEKYQVHTCHDCTLQTGRIL